MSTVTASSDVLTKKSSFSPGAVAVGLLKNDLPILPLLCMVLASSALLDVLTLSLGRPLRFSILTIDRVVQIAVVGIIVLRWRRKLQAAQGPRVKVLPVLVRIAAVSIAASIVFTTPFFGIAMSRNLFEALPFVLLLIVGAIWCLRVYLFFAVAALLGLPMGAALTRSVALAKSNMRAILNSLISPIAFTLGCSAICLMPYPDGRSLTWTAAASACEGIFWILSTYTGLGLALTMFSENEWKASGLSHYRTERLSTLETQGGKTLPKYLAPRFGFILLGVSLCLWVGNMIRSGQLPPAAKVVVKSVSVSDYKITVALDLEDREFKYRGFQPLAFFIATKTGTPQSNGLLGATQAPDSEGMIAAIKANDGEPATLYLTFSSPKTGEVLRSLDNMWLWYRLSPLAAITPEMLQGAKPVPEEHNKSNG